MAKKIAYGYFYCVDFYFFSLSFSVFPPCILLPSPRFHVTTFPLPAAASAAAFCVLLLSAYQNQNFFKIIVVFVSYFVF